MNKWRKLLMMVAVCAAFMETPAQAVQADPFDLAPARRLTQTDIARIGGYDEREPYVFSRFAGGAVLSTEEVALVDASAREIRVFGMNGVFRRRFGRAGQGPGEFSGPPKVVPLANGQLLAWDAGGVPRFTTFTVQGEHVSTERVENIDQGSTVTVGELQGGAWGTPSFVGALPDGALVLRQVPGPLRSFALPPGPHMDSVRLLLYSPVDRTTKVLATVDKSERVLHVAGDVRSWRSKLFDREVAAAVMPGGLVFGNTGSAALHRISRLGTSQARWEFRARRRTVSAATVRAERDKQVEELAARRAPEAAGLPGGVPAELSRLQQERAENVEAHATFPEFRSLLSGSDGTLWLEDYPLPGAGTVRWYRIEGGLATAWFDMPAAHSVLAIGHGLLVHVVKDEFGVETAIVSRLGG